MTSNLNGFTKKQIEEMQSKIDEYEKSTNSYSDVFNNFVNGFILDTCSNIKTIKTETLQNWFNNPDDHLDEIQNLLTYYYIIDGDIFQLYDLIFSLPKLDYKISSYTQTKTYDKDVAKIKQVLDRKIGYKRLTRDLLIQEAHDGTVIGTWLGDKDNPYFHIFDNLEYTFPYGLMKGKMTAVYDLEQLDKMSEIERMAHFENLKPLISKARYDKWKSESDTQKKKELKYVILPQDKTLVARGHTLYRNQRYGIPYGTQSLFDIIHKQKMKQLERSIADKVIRAISILKFKGKDENDNVVTDSAKKKVFSAVKMALTKNSTKDGIRVIALPDFAEYDETEMKGIDEALDPKKYESTDDDISNSIGISRVLTNGTKGNFASAKLNLETLYQKIAVMLEEIEEIYNQLICIILGEKKGVNYKFEFNKEAPLPKEKRVAELSKLVDKGYSIKFLLDELGIDRDEFIRESIYEIDTLQLREKIIPPLTSNVLSGKEGVGNTANENPTNDNTVQSQSTDSNNNPKAGI